MKELTKTLAKIQGKLSVPKNQYNEFGHYNYRSCEDIVEAVKKLLPDGIALIISDELVMIGDRYYVKAVAYITDGESKIKNPAYAREAENKKGMDESQITGAASSYARKYALNGLFGIDDVGDADTQNNTKARGKKEIPKVDMQDPTDMICDNCKANAVVSSKSGSLYCPNWKDHKANKEKGTIISKEDKEFLDGMPKK